MASMDEKNLANVSVWRSRATDWYTLRSSALPCVGESAGFRPALSPCVCSPIPAACACSLIPPGRAEPCRPDMNARANYCLGLDMFLQLLRCSREWLRPGEQRETVRKLAHSQV